MSTVPKQRGKVKAPEACRLVLSIGKTDYAVVRLAESDGAVKAFSLGKTDGKAYHVGLTMDGPTCDCPDFSYRSGHTPAGCKHIQGLRAFGLLPDLVEAPF
jgi:hypothetical protein